MSRFRAFTWNPGDRQPATAKAELIAMLADHQPHVAVVTEAYKLHAFLADIKGYRLRQLRRGEGSGIAVLVRDDVKIRRGRLLRMARPWVGPKLLKPHAPRIYRRLVLEHGGRIIVLDAVHFPPGGPSGGVVTDGRNAPAWAESARRVGKAWRRAAERMQNGRAVVFVRLAMGDFNATVDELEPLAEQMDAVLCPGSKVDHAIVRGARHLDTRRLLRVQPHPPLLFTFDLEEIR